MWDKLKNSRSFWTILIGLVLFGGGYILGLQKEVPVQIVEKRVEDTETKQKLIQSEKLISSLQKQLTIAESQITDLKTHVKTVVRIVKQKDGTVIVDRTTESDTSKRTEDNKNVSETTNSNTTVVKNTTVETDIKSHVDTVKITTPLVKDKYYLGLSSGLSLKGITDPGLEFKYRIFDLNRFSLWSGAEIIVPTFDFKLQDLQGRLSLGVSF